MSSVSSTATNPSPNPSTNAKEAKGAATEAARRELHKHLQQTASFIKILDLLVLIFAWISMLLAVWLAASVVDHWILPLPTALRWAIWLGCIALSGWWFMSQFVPLLLQRINLTYAARRIEHLVPEFKNGLISWLELENLPESGVPKGVMAALTYRAKRFIGGQEPSATVDTSPLIKLLGCALLLSMVLIIYAMVSPKSVAATGKRVLMPWASLAAPARVTILKVQPGDVELTQGRPLELDIEIQGLMLDEPAFVRYSSTDGQIQDVVQPLEAVTEGFRYGGEVATVNGGVEHELDYWIEAGDAKAGPFRVTLSPLPTVILKQVELNFPEYTKLEPRIVESGKVEAVEGSMATVVAVASQPIKKGTLEINPEVGDDFRLLRADATLNMHVKDRELQADYLMVLNDQQQNPTTVEYRIRGLNLRSEANARPIVHSMSVLADLAPEITLVGPDSRVWTVSPASQVELEVRASDPDFGLSQVEIQLALNGRKLTEKTLLKSAGEQGRQVLTTNLDLSKLRLTTEDRLQIIATAKDNRHDPESKTWSPNTTTSDALILEVVDPRRKKPDLPAPSPKEQEQPETSSKEAPTADEIAKMLEQNNKPDQQDESPSPPQQSSSESSLSGGEQQQQPGAQSSSSTGEDSAPDGRNQNSGRQDSDSQSESTSANSGSAGGDAEATSTAQQAEGQQSGSGAESTASQKPSENGNSSGQPGNSNNGQDQSAATDGQNSSDGTSNQSRDNTSTSAPQSGSNSNSSPTGKGQGNGNSPPLSDREVIQRIQERIRQSGDSSQSGETGSTANSRNESSKSDRENTGDRPEGQENQQAPGQRPQDPAANASNQSGSQNPESPDATDPNAQQNGTGQQSRPDGQDGSQAGSDPRSKAQQTPEAQEPDSSSTEGSNQSNPNAGSEASRPDNSSNNAPGQSGTNESPQTSPPEQTNASDQSTRPEESNRSQNESAADHSSQSGSQQPGDGQSGSEQSDTQQSGQSGAGQSGQSGESGAGQSGQSNAEQSGQSSSGQSGESGESGSSQSGQSGSGQSGQSGQSSSGQSGESGSGQSGQSGAGESGAGQSGSGQSGQSGQSGSGQSGESGAGQSGQSGAGESGAGQSGSGQPGQSGQSGSGQSGESGAGQSGQSGAGESGSGQSGSGQSGQSGQSGSGQSGESGAGQSGQSGAGESGSGQSGSGQSGQSGQGASSGGQNSGGQGSGSSGSGTPSQGGAPSGGQGSGGGAGSDTPSADAVNEEYAEQTTNMVLDYLNRQKDQPDPELLDDLGWSEQDLQEFLRRWNSARDMGQSGSEEERRQWDAQLRDLGLRPPTMGTRRGANRNDSFQQMTDSGSRVRPPESWRSKFEAYQKALEKLNRQRQ